jgi:hypothetical protein
MRLWIPDYCNADVVKGKAVYLRTLPDLTRIYTTIWQVELWMWYHLQGVMAIGRTSQILIMAEHCKLKLERNDRGFYVIQH